MDETELALEALREMRGLTTWIVGLFAVATGIGAGVYEATIKKHTLKVKAIIILSALSVGCLLFIIFLIPYVIDQIDYMDLTENGVAQYKIFGFFPLYWLYGSFYGAIFLSGVIGLRIIWLELFPQEK